MLKCRTKESLLERRRKLCSVTVRRLQSRDAIPPNTGWNFDLPQPLFWIFCSESSLLVFLRCSLLLRGFAGGSYHCFLPQNRLGDGFLDWTSLIFVWSDKNSPILASCRFKLSFLSAVAAQNLRIVSEPVCFQMKQLLKPDPCTVKLNQNSCATCI